MKKLIYAVLISLFVVIGFTTLIANTKNGKGLKKDQRLEKLNLTEQQKVKFDEIKFEFRENNIDLEANMKKNKLEIQKIMATGNIDENTLMNFIDKGSVLMSEKRKSRVQMWLNVREILDDSQKKIWTKNFKNFGERKKEFSGKKGKKAKRFHKNNCDDDSNKRQKRAND